MDFLFFFLLGSEESRTNNRGSKGLTIVVNLRNKDVI